MSTVQSQAPTLKSALLLMLFTAGLTSCSLGTGDLQRWVSEVRQRPAPPLPPLEPIRQYETFEYSAQGMRDPFSPPVANRDGGDGPRPDNDRRKEILEAFPLDGMVMVGTIGGATKLVGLVMAPDKVVYKVRFGNYMGQNDGRITGIYEDRIELVELVTDGAGGWLERKAQVALAEN